MGSGQSQFGEEDMMMGMECNMDGMGMDCNMDSMGCDGPAVVSGTTPFGKRRRRKKKKGAMKTVKCGYTVMSSRGKKKVITVYKVTVGRKTRKYIRKRGKLHSLQKGHRVYKRKAAAKKHV